MYRLNPLHRNVLITTDEVIAKAPVDQDVDVRNLQNSIEVAEIRFITPILGYTMYDDFVNMKNVVVTSGNKATLETAINLDNTGEPIQLIAGQIINAIELVTNSWYKDVWNRFLWKIAAECVAYVSIPTNAIRSTASGEMQNNPAGPMGGQGAAGVDLKMIKYKRDATLSDRIDPLIEAMRMWLCTNKAQTLLNLWDSSSCVDCAPVHKRMTGYVHGVYDEDYKNNCDCKD